MYIKKNTLITNDLCINNQDMQNRKLNCFQNVKPRVYPHPGLGQFTPASCVPEVRKAIEFYKLLFSGIRSRASNFTIDKKKWNFEADSPAISIQTSSFISYYYVDDVKALVEKIRKDGTGDILTEPEIIFEGDLKASIQDPFGYIWYIAEKANS